METARGIRRATCLLLLLFGWCATHVEASCGDYVMTRAELEQHAKAGLAFLPGAFDDTLNGAEPCHGPNCRRSDPVPMPVPSVVTLELSFKSIVTNDDAFNDSDEQSCCCVSDLILLNHHSTEVWRPPETQLQL